MCGPAGSGKPTYARTLEGDERNVAAAQAAATDLPNVRVVQADAGDPAAYVGSVPADLMLMAGGFGNVSDADVYRTIEALPQLCAAGATLMWTRSRRSPDLTPTLRCWLKEAGFVEHAFHAPAGLLFSVGVHRFAGVPVPLSPPGRLFQFVS